MMLKIPKQFSRYGIKVKCLKCKNQVTETCGMTQDKISSCSYKDKHRFNLIVCVPHSENMRRSKIIQTKDFDTALVERIKFREELKVRGYHKHIAGKADVKNTFEKLAMDYIDHLSGVNTYTFLIRSYSEDHIDDCSRVLSRFTICLKKQGYNTEILDVKDIGDNEVQAYHDYLINELKLGRASYNKHFAIMKAFINWLIRKKDLDIKNHFSHAVLHSEKKEINIITKIEFESLLQVLTYENGFVNRKDKSRNCYKPWLKSAFKLAIETGLRREELILLKWSDLLEIENGSLVFRINNLKVNRISSGENSGKYIKHIPVTKTLKHLLIELGLNEKKDTDDYIIERPIGTDVNFLMASISLGWSHFIKLTTSRPIQFKDLRKTYISHLAQALGSSDKLRLFTGHTNHETLQAHYLSTAFLAGNLSDFSMF
jgi:integrase